MQRCIDLAKNGRGSTSPNPLVGALVVHDNTIIGEGWHKKAGTAHAEVVAINSVKNKALLSESTLYVSLEPCSHFGKTPPCADLIVSEKLAKVVVGCKDPNPLVAGNGIKKLLDANIEVEYGVLEQECIDLNNIFFVNQRKNRPFITLKWAQSNDGFMDINRAHNEQGSFAISGIKSKVFVHKLRAHRGAILIGSNTARTDNPTLSTRWYGGESPVRLILNKADNLPKTLRVFNDNKETVVFVSEDKLQSNSKFKVALSEQEFLLQMLRYCIKINISSILVEGGKQVLQSFLEHNLWDEIFVIQSDIFLNEGLKAPLPQGELLGDLIAGTDVIKHYQNNAILTV